MKTLVILNWKMNPSTLAEAEQLFGLTEKNTRQAKNIELVICPPFVYLPSFVSRKSWIKPGAQNCFFKKKGAFTGEVSPLQLKDLGCEYVIAGHSERRDTLKEDCSSIREKISLLLRVGITPVLCVGEKEGDEITATTAIREQIKSALQGVSRKGVIIAYEPLFAIGTGNSCPADLAAKRRLFIKSVLSKMRLSGEDTPVLYGGSVNAKNAKQYIEAGFQGLLLGGASLKPEELKKITKSIQ